MTANRQKRLEKAHLRIMFSVPFFFPAVARLPVRFVDAQAMPSGIPTACTDGKEIVWCAEWFDKLDDGVVTTVLCHEACHCLLGHLWRMPVGGEPRIWNWSGDHVINLMLKEFSAQMTAKRQADPFPFPPASEEFIADCKKRGISPIPDPYLADPQFTGMCEEAIYAVLIQNAVKVTVKVGKGSGKGNSGANSGLPDGSMPDFGQFIKPAGGEGSEAANKQLQNDWAHTLIQSAQAMKGRGDVPMGISRLVEAMVTPKVRWQDILRNSLRERINDDWDWQKPCMEYSDSGFIMPSLYSEKMAAVVFDTDTSGSVSAELLGEWQCEKQNCLDVMRPTKLIDIYCDAKVHEVREYSPGDTIRLDCPGGGGTAFDPILDYADAMHPQPKAVVILTDGDGSLDATRKPDYHVIWLVYGSKKQMPLGETINITDSV